MLCIFCLVFIDLNDLFLSMTQITKKSGTLNLKYYDMENVNVLSEHVFDFVPVCVHVFKGICHWIGGEPQGQRMI